LGEPQLAHVERRLAVCPNIRGTDLFAELISSLCTFRERLHHVTSSPFMPPYWAGQR